MANQHPIGNDEITGNTVGRTANKGMEGLAITPDGRTLVGIMQTALIQDFNQGGAAANLLRIVAIDVRQRNHSQECTLPAHDGNGRQRNSGHQRSRIPGG